MDRQLSEMVARRANRQPLRVYFLRPAARFDVIDVSRSPVVRKTTQSGVYELDTEAQQRLRRRIAQLHGELRELTTPSADRADLREIRIRRKELTAAIGHAERALEEAELLLSAGDAPEAPADASQLACAS